MPHEPRTDNPKPLTSWRAPWVPVTVADILYTGHIVTLLSWVVGCQHRVKSHQFLARAQGSGFRVQGLGFRV